MIRRLVPALFVASMLCGTAFAQLNDVNDSLAKVSEAGVAAQFLNFPLPMTNYLKGNWKVGFSGGYASIKGDPTEGNPFNAAGPEVSASFSYSWADHWGLYIPVFYSDLKISGGGISNIIAETNNSNSPYNFINPTGDIDQIGAGLVLIWDPLVKGPESISMPIGVGVVVDQFSYSGVSTGFQSQKVPADRGMSTLTSNSSSPMPFVSIELGINLGKNIKMIPSLISTGRDVTGTMCSQGQGGNNGGGCKTSLAGIDILAPGLTVTYRPWGLSSNLGATFYSGVFHGNSLQYHTNEIKSTAFYNISWAFGKYAK